MAEDAVYRRGQVYTWHGMVCILTRVAADQSWADMTVEDDNGNHRWRKRIRLPLDDTFLPRQPDLPPNTSAD